MHDVVHGSLRFLAAGSDGARKRPIARPAVGGYSRWEKRSAPTARVRGRAGPRPANKPKRECIIPRAVLKNGVIYQLEPLPSEWVDGQELEVAPVHPPVESPEAIARWAEEMETLCANSDPEDEARMLAAIEEQRREAKAQARHMNLAILITDQDFQALPDIRTENWLP